jgi:hypothetical protein
MRGTPELASFDVAAVSVPAAGEPLRPLDRLAVAYLTVPLAIFVAGWLEPWAAVILGACIALSLRPLIGRLPQRPAAGFSALQLGAAIATGLAWTMLGGLGHFLFTNADWHVRDAVLHDLVLSPWPVGYGELDGSPSLLRAPLAYFLPAALAGKAAGLTAAHLVMAAWTALGASLFLLQVLSLASPRPRAVATVIAVIVLFSGLDILGSALAGGLVARLGGILASHIEWWAGRYQYSAMTTQLFWVPNHALGAWLAIGLLWRNATSHSLATLLPIIAVALALWSPLAALGVVPFMLWQVVASARAAGSLQLLHPRVWAPALTVGLVIGAYLALDAGGVAHGWSHDAGEGLALKLLRHAQFFLVEAGFIGAAVLALRRSGEVVLALAILAVLPFAQLGPGNDLVMRASIPSLAVLAIGACLALLEPAPVPHAWRRQALLGAWLAGGAVTAVHEFARAVVLPARPVNREATLIGTACGAYPAHYVARLAPGPVALLLRRPHTLPIGPQGPAICNNPAYLLMWKAHLL